jgi:hypothetical protein
MIFDTTIIRQWVGNSTDNKTKNICKTQIDVRPLIDIQSSNPCPISTSQTYEPQIYVSFSNSQIGVQFSNLCPFSNSQIGVQFSNLWSFLTFSNRRLMASLTYAITITLTLTNKSAINLRIWNVRRFENALKSDRDLR